MAEAVGLAASIAQLVVIAVQITQFSYGYVSDVRNASRTQKTYLQEVSALTDVLFRLEEAIQESEAAGALDSRPQSLSHKAILECHQKLALQRSKLEKHIARLIWPFQDRELKRAIDDLHRFRSIFADYITINIAMTSSATFRSVVTLKQGQERNELLEWLQKPHSTSRTKPTPLPGTGSWLLNHPKFQEWRTEAPSILWCYGPPGVGKSSLASIAIDELFSTRNSNDACISHYFSDFATRKQQTKLVILQTILAQLVEQGCDQVIEVLKKSRNESPSELKANHLSQAFAKICSRKKVYLILDAPDELQNTEIILNLRSFVDAGCKVLVSSRDHPDLREALSTAKQVEVHASSEDLTSYVEHRFRETDFRDSSLKAHDLVVAIVKKANGLFLLAKLLMDQLLGLPTIKKMRRSLEDLPTQLSGAYESSVERIDAQPEALRDIGHRLIGWVVHAERPLKPAEITHAFAIEPEDNEIDQESIPMIQTLLRACAGLVVLDHNRNSLVMVHISAYEFFYIPGGRKSRWHEDIARTCLTYLCLRPLQAGPCSNIDDMNRRLKELPFLQYAARKWGKHSTEPEVEERLSPFIHRLLEDSNLTASSFQALQYRDEIRDHALAKITLETLPKEQKGLHIAAYWGLQRTTRELLERGEESNCLDSQQWAPLHWAASEGQLAVMKLLLEGGAAVDSQDSQRWTSLFWSSLNGDVPALRFLLEKGANHFLRDFHGWTALHWAVSKGKEESVNTLLEHHAHYLAKDRELSIWSRLPDDFYHINESLKALDWQTPMEVAAEAGDATIFDTLLKSWNQTGEDSLNDSWPSGHFDPPMSNLWRVMNKAERINGIESYVSGVWWSDSGRMDDQIWKTTMLHSAIKDQNLPVVQLLIDIGADVNYNKSRSALHAAAFRKDPSFTQLLLERGANVLLRDCHGQTALHQAVLNGFEETIACLLRGGSDVNARRKSSSSRSKLVGWDRDFVDNQTPLMLACGYVIESTKECDAQTRIIDLLLAHGADVSLQDDKAQTCLHHAVMAGSVDVVQRILALSTDMNVKDKDGIVAFHHAARSCNIRLVQLMVDRGADIRSIDNYERGAIHHLAEGDESGFEIKDLTHIFELIYTGMDPSILNAEYDAVKARGGWTSSANLSWHTAISVAIEKRNWNLFQIFKESNAALPRDISPLLEHAIEALQPAAVHFLFEHGAKLESLGSLRFAIRQHSASMNARDLDLVLKDLTNHGLDLNEHDDWSGTILKGAATNVNSKCVAQMLLRNGANVYDPVDGFDSFLWAAVSGNLEFLDGLLVNASGSAPGGHWTHNLEIRSVTGYNDLENVCVALERSKQLESLGRKGHTILSAAISAGNHQFVKRLLAHGADTELSDNHGWRPLHYAVVGGHEAIVEYLLNAGTEVNAPTETWTLDHVPRPSGLYKGDAWTGSALHIATMVGNKEIVRILLDNGADVTASTGANIDPDNYPSPLHGPTALHIALGTGRSYGVPGSNLDEGRLGIAKMLIKRGASVDKVADHLTLRDRGKFKNYQDVWKKIGTGVSKGGA